MLWKGQSIFVISFCFETSAGGEICSAPAKIFGAAFCPPDSTRLICQALLHAYTHTHVHARLVTHTCIHNLVGEASVSVREQSFLACCKQTFYTPSLVSALLFSLAKGSSSANPILSNGHPTVINKDTGSSARWTVPVCKIFVEKQEGCN